MTFALNNKDQATSFIRQRSSEELRAFVERKLNHESLQEVSLYQ